MWKLWGKKTKTPTDRPFMPSSRATWLRDLMADPAQWDYNWLYQSLEHRKTGIKLFFDDDNLSWMSMDGVVCTEVFRPEEIKWLNGSATTLLSAIKHIERCAELQKKRDAFDEARKRVEQ